ncbi:MAG: hypothetical protein FD129_2677, partial [bacterium]
YLLPTETGSPTRIFEWPYGPFVRGSDDRSVAVMAADSLYILTQPSMQGAVALALPEGAGNLIQFDIDWTTRRVAIATRVAGSETVLLHIGGPLPADYF